MDFGLVGSDNTSSGFGSDGGTKYGSGFVKQERSDAIDDDWRSSKLSKTTESMLLPQKNSLPKSNNHNSTSSSSLFPYAQQQQQMLSFSCPKSEAEKIPQNLALPGFYLTSYYNRGCNDENLNSGNMHWPFTSSQWMELQHQAWIYKYITANVPIPSNLIIPMKRALDYSALSAYSGGLLRPNTLSWGGFHLGLSSNNDPEPGRCRRTDGKKWRCSRDAVVDQKYCERHINRGRHRSRKHVEAQSGNSAAAATTSKLILTVSSATASPAVVGLSGSGASNIAHNQQQLKNLQSQNSSLNRMFLNKEKPGERVHDSPKTNPKSKENPFSILKQQIEFGRVNSDSLLNPSHNRDQQNIPQHSIRQFMDDWPTSQPDQNDGIWPHLDVQTNRTQLSNSIPTDKNPALSPLRLSCDLGLNAFNQRQATNWMPVPWETSMGGPLGEALHNSGSEWDNSSHMGYSPTGVLQKPKFGSLSNSSAGSSPIADRHRANEDAILSCDFLAPI